MKQKLEFNIEGLTQVLNVFKNNNVKVRLVGGCVRDCMLGVPFQDVDLTSSLEPNEAKKLFEKEGFKVIPTGIEHGTITILSKGNNFELTTLRKDVKTDGRYAVVEYTDCFNVDASRRDFTINALSYDPFSKEIYDYFGGLEDLKNNIVKFIGDPNQRITEDYLRIMRFFRFSAFYAKSLDQEGVKACINNLEGLTKISKERIYIEITRMLSYKKDISISLEVINNIELFPKIAPNFEYNFLAAMEFEKNFNLYQEIEVNLKNIRLALLTFNMGKKPAKEFMKNLKFSNAEILTNTILLDFISNISVAEKKEEIVYEICKNWYYQPSHIKEFLVISHLFEKINQDELIHNSSFMKEKPPKMPIASSELITFGYEGLRLGIRIQFLEKQWIKSGFSASKEELHKAK